MSEIRLVPALSVCMIVKNEEKMLPDCLESLSGVAREIIIVDTGSEDSTIDIAKKFNATVIEVPWENDFAKARNSALELAKFPYILSIDADERLVNPDDLKRLLFGANPNTGGWLIEVRSEAKRSDGYYDVYTANLLRLFRNNPAIRFTGIIHEQIIESVLSVGYKLENSSIRLNHLGYSRNPEEMKKKQLRNLELLNASLLEKPNDAYSLYQRAKTYLALGELEKAEADTLASLKVVKHDSAVKPQMLNYGAVIAFQLKNYSLALERAHESLGLVPNQAFANFILGETYTETGHFDTALLSYQNMQKALSATDTLARVIGDYSLPSEQLHFKIGKCLVVLNRFQDAENEFSKGNKINPNDISCLVGLANTAFHFKDYAKSRKYLSAADNIQPGRDDIKKFILQVELAQDSEAKKESFAFNQGRTKFESKPAPPPAMTSEKPFITLSMIVKNEEKYLAECLESVWGVVDEIVIVDTGSTDGTKEIAKHFGAKVYDFEWINDFSAARNEAMKRSNGEWILYLDADERLDPISAKYVRTYLSQAPEDLGGLICIIESDHAQLDGSAELHRGGYPRIFRNIGFPQIYFQGRVHEQITPSILALGKTFANSDIIIKHLGYNQPRPVMEGKIKRNYKMLLEHVNEDPVNGYAWYQLGQTLANMGLNEEAEKAVRFSIECGNLSSAIYASASATISQMCGNKKNYEEALMWAERSLEKAPGQVYALNLRAYSFLHLGRFSEAEAEFLKVLERMNQKRGVPQSGFDIEIPEKVVQHGLSEARKALGK